MPGWRARRVRPSDGLGDVTASTDATNKTTQNFFDLNGNLTESIDPDNGITYNSFDRFN